MADKVRKTIEVVTDASSSVKAFDSISHASKNASNDMIRLNEHFNDVLERQIELLERISSIEDNIQSGKTVAGSGRGAIVDSGQSNVVRREREEQYHERYKAPERQQGNVSNVFGIISGTAGSIGGGLLAGLGIGAFAYFLDWLLLQ